MIRPAVVLRKNSQSNRSERGAAVQSILMSVYQTSLLSGYKSNNGNWLHNVELSFP